MNFKRHMMNLKDGVIVSKRFTTVIYLKNYGLIARIRKVKNFSDERDHFEIIIPFMKILSYDFGRKS